MRLKYQLFLILLLLSALLVGLTAAISSWNFDRGFIGYINDAERQRLDPLADALVERYALEGSWDWATDRPREWRKLLDSHLPFRARARRIRRGEETVNQGRPLSRSRRDEPRTLTFDPRLILADAHRTPLIGRDNGSTRVHWQALRLDGDVVGYLGHRQRDIATPGLDRAFAQQQRRGFLLSALAMALLCAPIAAIVAGRFVKPLLNVNETVARIGNGEYGARVPDARTDEIGDLSRTINTMASTLEQNLDARRQWLAEISHELRTPVAILRSELEAIQDGVTELDQNAVSSLHTETLRLTRLIDDLRDLTLSDAGALDYRFEPVDLHDIVAARIAQARNQPEASSITLTLTSAQDQQSLLLNADTQRLGQLVDNLIQNSFRYTDKGGTVNVELSRANDKAVLQWSDSSPGVADEHLSQLFDPLYRVDASRNRVSGGSGLGLAIVRRIVEAHAGSINASHSSLGGLALRVELPLAKKALS